MDEENANPQRESEGVAAMELDEPAGLTSKGGGGKKDETQLPWVEKYRPKR